MSAIIPDWKDDVGFAWAQVLGGLLMGPPMQSSRATASTAASSSVRKESRGSVGRAIKGMVELIRGQFGEQVPMGSIGCSVLTKPAMLGLGHRSVAKRIFLGQA
jgi:hypothetical protein